MTIALGMLCLAMAVICAFFQVYWIVGVLRGGHIRSAKLGASILFMGFALLQAYFLLPLATSELTYLFAPIAAFAVLVIFCNAVIAIGQKIPPAGPNRREPAMTLRRPLGFETQGDMQDAISVQKEGKRYA